MTHHQRWQQDVASLGYSSFIAYVQTLASAFGVEESLARSCFLSVGWEITHEEFVAALQECVDRKKRRG